MLRIASGTAQVIPLLSSDLGILNLRPSNSSLDGLPVISSSSPNGEYRSYPRNAFRWKDKWPRYFSHLRKSFDQEIQILLSSVNQKDIYTYALKNVKIV